MALGVEWFEMFFKVFQHAILVEDFCGLSPRKLLRLLILLDAEGEEICDVKTSFAHYVFVFDLNSC
jgi:hypothetical protein